MLAPADTEFARINAGFDATFQAGRLSLGLVVPIERYAGGPVPEMTRHVERVELAERLGFAAVWLRDVPFNVPSFGDAGPLFDPFTYLGFLAARTSRIALGVASIVLPLRHPADVAKAAASADVLSGGRLVLGVASGDRPAEYPAMNRDFATRGESFRTGFDYIRRMAGDWPSVEGPHGSLDGEMDMLPKPVGGRLPLLVTGSSRQDPSWIAANADGWMTYPQPLDAQRRTVADWQAGVRAIGPRPKPVLQPLYIDLDDDPDALPRPIHLGLSTGVRPLLAYLQRLEAIGVNHVALNLRFQRGDVETTLERLADEILPAFAD